MDGARVVTFEIEREATLTSTRAEELTSTDARERLIVFERSSPQARELLRQAGLSYAAADGELFVHAPPVHVERPPRLRAVVPAATPSSPFANRSSRVPRWLLLNADERPSFRELAKAVELSEAMVSRTVHALADDGLVAIETDSGDARRRRVRLRDTRALLDAFEGAANARRVRRVTWDIGARDAAAAIELLRAAGEHTALSYAIGGLAGAAFVRRVVEPAEASVWISRDDPERWAKELVAVPARPGPGRITAQVAPDPFVLSLATSREGIHIADPVQLYLDCRRSGERALEAAEAIREEMNW
jgi:DNA-binding MarR family transcriptional regulator